MKRALFSGSILALLITGCHSDQGYRIADFSGVKTYTKSHAPGPQLTEEDVLGRAGEVSATDQDIEGILEQTQGFKLAAGSTLLLVQSGSAHPDSLMTDELSAHFRVVPHSGLPSDIVSEGSGVGKALRLAAARASAETVMVYWGKLELKRKDLPTGLVSWVPVVDFMVPDEYQRARMSLTIALINVRTGKWTRFQTEPVAEDLVTTRYAREHQSEWPLSLVKKKLYEAAVRSLKRAYVAEDSQRLKRQYAASMLPITE